MAGPSGEGGDTRESVAAGDTRHGDDPVAVAAAGVWGCRAPGPAEGEMLALGVRTSNTCGAAKGRKTAMAGIWEGGRDVPLPFQPVTSVPAPSPGTTSAVSDVLGPQPMEGPWL